MKHIFTTFVTLALLTYTQSIFAIDYSDILFLNESPEQSNTTSNINRAKLLCTHVENFQNNIENIGEKYGIMESTDIVQTIAVTQKMYSACINIQTKRLEKTDADDIISSIVSDLSVLNNGIKDHLKNQILELQQHHEKYSNASVKISEHLDTLTNKLEQKIYDKDGITFRDKQILSRIKKIRNISTKLNNFGKLEIYKTDEISASFVRLIDDLKDEIIKIRDL